MIDIRLSLSNKLIAIDFFYHVANVRSQILSYWNQTKMTKNVVRVGPVIQEH